MSMSLERMSGIKKAAVLILSLGQSLSAQVLRHLPREFIEAISREIVRVGNIEPDARNQILSEFRSTLQARGFVLEGGFDYARKLLSDALGEDQADEVLAKVASSIEERPFYGLRNVDASQLAQLLQHEQPQMVALVIAYLDPVRAAQVLSHLPAEVQGGVAQRIATMDRTTPEVVGDIENFLQARISSLGEQSFQEVGGVASLVEILNHSDRSTERGILETLGEKDPELASQVKDMMFVFEDMINLGPREMQMILKEVRHEDLILALKGAKEPLRNAMYENMSSRAAQRLKEDIEISPPARVRDVEEAQQRIVTLVRELEEKGDIAVRSTADERLIA